jgi:hypothetical protein
MEAASNVLELTPEILEDERMLMRNHQVSNRELMVVILVCCSNHALNGLSIALKQIIFSNREVNLSGLTSVVLGFTQQQQQHTLRLPRKRSSVRLSSSRQFNILKKIVDVAWSRVETLTTTVPSLKLSRFDGPGKSVVSRHARL